MRHVLRRIRFSRFTVSIALTCLVALFSAHAQNTASDQQSTAPATAPATSASAPQQSADAPQPAAPQEPDAEMEPAVAAEPAAAAEPATAAQSPAGTTTTEPAAAPSTTPAQPSTPSPTEAQTPPTPAPNTASQGDTSTPTGWKRCTFAADGFSASFPSDPDVQKKEVPTDAWTFELRTYTARIDSSALFIGVLDYGVTAESSEPAALLQGVKTGFVKNVKGKLMNEKPALLEDKPGLTFEVESDSMHFFSRIYLIGTTLYQEHVASPLKDIYPAPNLFFESFHLVPRSGAAQDGSTTAAAPSAPSPQPASSTDASMPQ